MRYHATTRASHKLRLRVPRFSSHGRVLAATLLTLAVVGLATVAPYSSRPALAAQNISCRGGGSVLLQHDEYIPNGNGGTIWAGSLALCGANGPPPLDINVRYGEWYTSGAAPSYISVALYVEVRYDNGSLNSDAVNGSIDTTFWTQEFSGKNLVAFTDYEFIYLGKTYSYRLPTSGFYSPTSHAT